MKVIRTFFCLQEKKTYNVGDTYTGKRKDLTSYMDPKSLKKKSAAPNTKNKNAAPKTANKKKG